MSTRDRQPPSWLGKAVAGVGVVAALITAWLLARSMLAGKPNTQRPQAQIITMIRPPPPPPDQPPPPPPPPDKVEEPVPQDNPQPDQSPDPTPEQLGLDADASAGSDSFGLAARSGGSDIVGGTGTAIFGRYTSRLASAINDCLSSDEQLRKQGGYSGSVHVWLDADGRITRMTMWQSTGKPEVDALIPQSKGCRSLRIADGPPPIEMPQPVNLKIVSRG